jgi:hypothetical protein
MTPPKKGQPGTALQTSGGLEEIKSPVPGKWNADVCQLTGLARALCHVSGANSDSRALLIGGQIHVSGANGSDTLRVTPTRSILI